jgi:hypothetical protein
VAFKEEQESASLFDALFSVVNAMVVSVSSGEQHASLVAMRGFTQLHRLLLALVEERPELGKAAEVMNTKKIMLYV